MRRSLKNGILVALELGGLLIADAIILSHSPYSKNAKIINKRVKEILVSFFPNSAEKDTKRSLKNAIYKLKKDGLIGYEDTTQGKSLFITQKGKEYLNKENRKSTFPDRKYPRDTGIQEDKSLKIIIFDIPEKERNKRDWLRAVIKNLGFKHLQQSVWAGSNPIPKSFLEDLKELQILRFVEIFSVSRTGTIEKQSFE